MNIYDMLRTIIRGCTMTFGDEADALKLVDNLERQNGFGTIVRITSGSHRWTRQSNQTDECGLCSKPRSEHEE